MDGTNMSYGSKNQTHAKKTLARPFDSVVHHKCDLYYSYLSRLLVNVAAANGECELEKLVIISCNMEKTAEKKSHLCAGAAYTSSRQGGVCGKYAALIDIITTWVSCLFSFFKSRGNWRGRLLTGDEIGNWSVIDVILKPKCLQNDNIV